MQGFVCPPWSGGVTDPLAEAGDRYRCSKKGPGLQPRCDKQISPCTVKSWESLSLLWPGGDTCSLARSPASVYMPSLECFGQLGRLFGSYWLYSSSSPWFLFYLLQRSHPCSWGRLSSSPPAPVLLANTSVPSCDLVLHHQLLLLHPWSPNGINFPWSILQPPWPITYVSNIESLESLVNSSSKVVLESLSLMLA